MRETCGGGGWARGGNGRENGEEEVRVEAVVRAGRALARPLGGGGWGRRCGAPARAVMAETCGFARGRRGGGRRWRRAHAAVAVGGWRVGPGSEGERERRGSGWAEWAAEVGRRRGGERERDGPIRFGPLAFWDFLLLF